MSSERAGSPGRSEAETNRAVTAEGITTDMKLCRMCLMAVIVFAFGKEALMFI